MRRTWRANLEMNERKTFGSRYFHLSSVDSTNEFARTQVSEKENDHDGTVIIAYEQTHGKGRLDRDWVSPPGGIYFSLILGMTDPGSAGLLNVLSALPVANVICRFGIDCGIKWPNDLMIGDRKVGGILGELVVGERPCAIIGMGINSNFRVSRLPKEIREKSTTLMDEVGREVPNPRLVEDIVQEYDGFLKKFKKGEIDDLLVEYKKLSVVIGKQVVVKGVEEAFEGTAEGIGTDGSLILRVGDEVRRTVEGDVLECRTV